MDKGEGNQYIITLPTNKAVFTQERGRFINSNGKLFVFFLIIHLTTAVFIILFIRSAGMHYLHVIKYPRAWHDLCVFLVIN